MFLSPGVVETSSKSLKSQEFSFIDVTIALAEKLNCTNLVKIYIRLDEKFLVPIHRVAASSNVDCVTTNEFTFYLCCWYILLMQGVACCVRCLLSNSKFYYFYLGESTHNNSHKNQSLCLLAAEWQCGPLRVDRLHILTLY